MIGIGPLPRRLMRDRSGSVILEFAILAPAVIGLMLGVFQVGLAMQSYNALRSVTADTARYAIVEYQKGETPTLKEIEDQAFLIARGAPYLLDNSSLVIRVTDAATQRVTGAKEMTVTISYQAPVVLPFFSWASPTVSYNRPIFVLD